MVIVFTIIMIIAFWRFQTVPDSLIVAFFGAFGLEGGYCAFIHKLKKERQMKMDLKDNSEETNNEQEDGLVIDDEGEY